ncbi:carbohydrate-binding module family 1 protein [Parathielavia hyrcaniae]|uniref:Glucanase n=1 Tax=Parathielavia hyrcaniae TaxID=113614 RepID=A0AAN6PWM0_9PEZI|nr:carbohydrate-binding module family 1 protein [Parathielavia hyrcaniae]
MRVTFAVLAGLLATGSASPVLELEARQSSNPFAGRSLLVNPKYSLKLEQTRQAFLSRGDQTNAAKVQYVQNNVGTFVWISNIFLLRDIDDAISDARAAKASGKNPIVGLVLYNLPDRDCSAGESSGELSLSQNGLNRYRNEYVLPFAQKLKAASDLQFAVVLEPDAIGNMVTGTSSFCQNARGPQQDGIAYAIQQLQASNIHLYLDVANAGWLGWPDNLKLTAAEVSTILQKAGSNAKIRGYSSNISNYNQYQTSNPPAYTEGSPSPDESRYATNLANALRERGLPTSFIIDQGRVERPGARSEWGQWCNISPAGFGQPPTTNTNNPVVDALVWVKPGGESDGECGMSGAPRAGAWFDAYAQMLATNAHPAISGNPPPTSTSTSSSRTSATPTPSATPTQGGGNCAARWGQCGGMGWTGPTCCSQGTCQVGNPWYSQCL